MFSVLDETLPISLLKKHDPLVALADHFSIRPQGWDEVPYSIASGGNLHNTAQKLATRLAGKNDLRFFKADVVWVSAESADKVADFRKRTGLDERAILRRCVIGDGATVEDWTALFGLALAFGWDAVAVSRRKNALLWFSHDEYLRVTPPSIVRRLWHPP